MTAPLLVARALRVEGPGGRPLVDGVSLALGRGEILALVGESGAGKTLTALALIGLVPPPARAAGGEVELEGRRLTGAGADALRRVRGARIGLVPQDPAAALDPVQRVGAGIAETLRAHAPLGRREASERAAAALAGLGVARDDHPHRLSGGQRQRALIAMALAPGPAVLIADEPTASVDPAVRVDVLDLLDARRRADGLAVLLISHDLGAVARIADRIAVMHAGRVVEEGPARALLGAPGHPRAARQVAAVPRLSPPPARPGTPPARPGTPPGPPALEVRDVSRSLTGRGGRRVAAVEGVSLTVGAGEAVGLVGPSGSGKTTLARLAVALLAPERGSVLVEGQDLARADRARLRAARRAVQIVFQDPYLSLDPRLTVGASIGEPMRIHGLDAGSRAARRAAQGGRVADLLAAVGLDPDLADRRPAGLSGGQRQRVAIARALALEPRLLVLDEPVSSLDRPAGAAIMELLARLQGERGLAYLLISHDLAALASAVDRVAVMSGGRVVEEGPTGRLLSAPAHPTTRELVRAAQDLSLVPWAWPGSTTQA